MNYASFGKELRMMKYGKSSLDSYYPDRVFVLEGYEEHDVTKNVVERYRKAEIGVVGSQHLENELVGLGEIVEWGKKTLLLGETPSFISQQKGQAVHYCKGPRKIIAISNGCHFSCEYCFLQGTYRGRHPRIKFNLNWERMLKEIDHDIEKRRMFGTQVYHMGENQDSLGFDYLYPLTRILVPFFAKRDARLLLLSKSDCVENLLDLKHEKHTIVSWSINSDYVTRHIEHDTAPLERRVSAAEKVQNKGYVLRLRFDPLLLLSYKEYKSNEWKRRYDGMMNRVLPRIKPERITLGSLRFHPGTRASSKQRYPDTIMFDNEMVSKERDEDGRYRYHDEIREKLYRYVAEGIRERSPKTSVGLCKETEEMWGAIGLELDKDKPGCHCQI